MSDLLQQGCEKITKQHPPLEPGQISRYLEQLAGWQRPADNVVEKTFHFNNYYETIAFVNAVAWIANQCDHHPDMQVSYNRCIISYTTHAINALSINDFICAARINQLVEE